MALQERYDIFEPGDLTALVCIDHPEIQPVVLDQLTAIDYRIHVGLFNDDVVLKLRSHPYDVIVISENFGGVDLTNNPIITTAITLPTTQRRRQFLALLGPSFVTNDEMMSFVYSVDLVMHEGDIGSFQPVLRRAVARHKEFYQPFFDVLKVHGGGM
ncbi:MAG: hypothetical protein ACFCU3_03340 [Verrucomicrobiales bacterium]